MVSLLIAIAAGFATTFVLTPLAMEFLRDSGIVGIDQQKADEPTLPTSGGIAVLFGFLMAMSLYMGLTTFAAQGLPVQDDLLLAALSSTLIIALIGLIDDIHVNEAGEEVKRNTQLSVGFRQWWVKPLFVLPAALPLMVVKAGHTVMTLPFIGVVDWGIVYPLVLVPIALVAVSNATNMLAGQNGLETVLGIILFLGLGTFTYLLGEIEGALIAFAMMAALLGFSYYNVYPARVLPGDALTYAIGAAFASAVIIANAETFGVVIFLPWIIEAFLKLRSRFQASSLGELQDDGTLRPMHDSIYSVTHVLMRLNVTEKQLVVYAAVGEFFLVVTALILFL
jgi:UDP-N-acetylglucosamine--dolichyl-phosphate N-acetylglucosaminephosphotransferase